MARTIAKRRFVYMFKKEGGAGLREKAGKGKRGKRRGEIWDLSEKSSCLTSALQFLDQIRVSHLWHHWHFELGNYLWWGTVLCTVGCLASPLASNALDASSTPFSPVWQLVSSDTAKCIPRSKIIPIWQPLAQNTKSQIYASIYRRFFKIYTF